ncbi:GAF domain-containing protein [Herbaspirillum sp. AP02]|uniref:GAF domain-containing protein n=1 Tax=unclassified Herbaspirillum TaxID=2624150 RepID=UPI0015D96C0E|nr:MULTISPECIES: GAF domain-containing protein [unclassified Herbaspirillum]MBG7621607.1 GAF domain-containing protein [Herbaspirillum sp. AP02]NZD69694.1 GAF domain-containing protein [Herbaspirillum sp. AP21]
MARAATLHESDAPSSDPAMTSREAANMLGVSITTAQMWMETGMLASWKTPGGHRRTRLSAVMTLLGHGDVKRRAQASEQALPDIEATHPTNEEDADLGRFIAQTIKNPHSETRFHRLTWLASELLEVPIALITFLTSDVQIFHATHGLNIAATPRSWAFSNHASTDDDVLAVSDASKDPRFTNNPMVTSAPFIRFYAGAPLMYQGKALGVLCVMDTEPRILRSHERRGLLKLAALATDMLALQIMEAKQH